MPELESERKEVKSEEAGEKQSSKPRRDSIARRETEAAEQKAEEKPAADMTPAGKPRRRRAADGSPGGTAGGGGWMSAPAKPTDNNGDVAPVGSPVMTETAAQNKNKHMKDDSDDEILIIPDLDEEGGADADQRVAHAPRNITRRIPTLSELENEAVAAIPALDTEGLDLSVLHSTLVPLELLKEDDVVWTFETLLAQATDEVNGTQQPKPKPKVKAVVQLSPVKGKKGKSRIGKTSSGKGRVN